MQLTADIPDENWPMHIEGCEDLPENNNFGISGIVNTHVSNENIPEGSVISAEIYLEDTDGNRSNIARDSIRVIF